MIKQKKILNCTLAQLKSKVTTVQLASLIPMNLSNRAQMILKLCTKKHVVSNTTSAYLLTIAAVLRSTSTNALFFPPNKTVCSFLLVMHCVSCKISFLQQKLHLDLTGFSTIQ